MDSIDHASALAETVDDYDSERYSTALAALLQRGVGFPLVIQKKMLARRLVLLLREMKADIDDIDGKVTELLQAVTPFSTSLGGCVAHKEEAPSSTIAVVTQSVQVQPPSFDPRLPSIGALAGTTKAKADLSCSVIVHDVVSMLVRGGEEFSSVTLQVMRALAMSFEEQIEDMDSIPTAIETILSIARVFTTLLDTSDPQPAITEIKELASEALPHARSNHHTEAAYLMIKDSPFYHELLVDFMRVAPSCQATTDEITKHLDALNSADAARTWSFSVVVRGILDRLPELKAQGRKGATYPLEVKVLAGLKEHGEWLVGAQLDGVQGIAQCLRESRSCFIAATLMWPKEAPLQTMAAWCEDQSKRLAGTELLNDLWKVASETAALPTGELLHSLSPLASAVQAVASTRIDGEEFLSMMKSLAVHIVEALAAVFPIGQEHLHTVAAIQSTLGAQLESQAYVGALLVAAATLYDWSSALVLFNNLGDSVEARLQNDPERDAVKALSFQREAFIQHLQNHLQIKAQVEQLFAQHIDEMTTATAEVGESLCRQKKDALTAAMDVANAQVPGLAAGRMWHAALLENQEAAAITLQNVLDFARANLLHMPMQGVADAIAAFRGHRSLYEEAYSLFSKAVPPDEKTNMDALLERMQLTYAEGLWVSALTTQAAGQALKGNAAKIKKYLKTHNLEIERMHPKLVEAFISASRCKPVAYDR